MSERGNAHDAIPSNGARTNDGPAYAGADATSGARADDYSPPAASEEFWKLVILEGCGLIVLGIVATLLPKLASLAVSLMTGWLLLIAGLFRFASIFSARGGPGYWGTMLLAAITVVLGALLVFFPVDGAVWLTFALALYLCAHGLTGLFVASAMRRATRFWFWIALAAAIDFLIAGLVIEGWPNDAPLVLGLYIGINLVVAGVALIGAAMGAHGTTQSTSARR